MSAKKAAKKGKAAAKKVAKIAKKKAKKTATARKQATASAAASKKKPAAAGKALAKKVAKKVAKKAAAPAEVVDAPALTPARKVAKKVGKKKVARTAAAREEVELVEAAVAAPPAPVAPAPIAGDPPAPPVAPAPPAAQPRRPARRAATAPTTPRATGPALPSFGPAGRAAIAARPLPPAPTFDKPRLEGPRPGPPAGVAVPSFLPDRIARAARRVFKIDRLHPEQARTIEAVLTGHDAMAVLPTGFGKSLIYQIPAVLSDRPVLVVSPLIALMRDQEDKLRLRGVPVVRLDSTLRAQERRDALARVEQGGTLVVLTTPETLQAKDAKPAIVKARPALLAVDEAHCISEWGHDFRPAYLQLAATRQTLGVRHVLALTATATPHVQEDIATRLALKDPVVVIAPPHRSNLRLGVHTVSGPSVKLEIAGRLLQRLPRPGILYCATTRAVDDIFAALSQTKIPCAKYHGGLSDEERSSAQARFMAKDGKIVMVATSAFGMGIDKPDIRYIVHFQVPGSLEQYVQEAGRAGRDGKQSDCVLLFDRADLSIQEFLEAQGRPTGAQLKRVASSLSAWSEEDGEGASPNDLALAAGVPAGAARAALAELGDLGLVTFDGKRRAVPTVDAKTLKKSTDELALRFDILGMQDKKRLDAITQYAEADETCRSASIRRYFGEKDPPVCGKCDVCRIRERIRLIEEAEARGEAPPPPDIYDVTANKLRQARQAVRRGGKRRGRPAVAGAVAGAGAAGGQKRGKRRGRGRQKRKAAR